MGRPKPWLELDGVPLLVHVVERCRPWVSEIVVVAAPGQDLPPLSDVAIVRDRHPGEGPLPALALGLATIAAPWALALGCDGPAVHASVVARLADERGADVDAVIPVWQGRPQPLVALYRRTLAPRLDGLVAAGERRLQAIAQLPRVRLVREEILRPLDPAGETFRTLNTPEEYAAAVAAWTASSR